MSLFHRKPRTAPIPFDPQTQQPAVRRSICTGEMTVGFIDKATGKFREYALAPDQAALEAFCHGTGIEPEELKTIY